MNSDFTLREIEDMVLWLPGDFVAYLLRPAVKKMLILSFTKSILPAFGVSEAEFIKITQENALDVVFPGDRERVLASVADRPVGTQNIDCSFRLLHRTKGFFWVHARSSIIGRLDGEPVLLTNYLNIDFETEPYAKILDYPNTGVTVVDRHTHEVLYANRCARESSYVPGGFFAGRKCYEYIRGGSSPCAKCLMGTGEPATEYRDDQRGRWMRVAAADLVWCGREACVHYITDVTADKEAVLRLQTENSNLAMTVARIPGGVVVTRTKADGSISFVTANPSFQKMTGCAPSDCGVAGDDVFSGRIHPDDRGLVTKNMRALAVPNGGASCDFRFLRQGGGYAWFHMEAQSYGQEDGSVLAFANVADVTEAREAEAKLAESREKYQAATEGAELLVFEYDVRARAIICPPYAAAKFGIPQRVENVPDSLLFQFHEKDHERFREFFRRVGAGEPRVSDDFWMVNTKDSYPVCIRFVYTTICGADGKPLKAYAVARNITAEKKNAEIYEKSVRKLLFMNQRSLGSFHLNLTQNSCGEAQSDSELILALQKDGTADGFFQANADRLADQSARRFYRQHINCASLIADFRAGRTSYSLDLRYLQTGGGSFWVNGNLQMMENPNSGDIEAVAYSYDISDRKREEAVIQKITNEEYDFIAIIDPASDEIEFRSVRNGPEFSLLRGKHKYLEFTGSVLHRVVVPQERDSFVANVSVENLTARLDADGSYLLACTTRSGSRLHRKQARYSWLDDTREKILLIQSDVTQLYEQERAHMREVEDALLSAERANEAKSAFMSSISHDMRTPLNGIIGFTNLALKEPASETVRGYLEKIRISGALLLDLINDTLTISKIESGKLSIEAKPEDAFELIDAITVPIRAAAEAKGVGLTVDASGVKRRWISADRNNVQKIFLNLLSNAVKFTPPGGLVEYIISGSDEAAAAAPGPNVFVTVRDSGIGISAKFLPHIYEPFAQEHEGGGGTGLGLSIVKRLVDMMGGSIKVKSVPGQGTEFLVSLRIPTAKASDRTQKNSAASVHSLDGARILLCEDNELNTEIAKTMLENMGAAVVCAADGKQGVEAFAASAPNEFDAVLMDIRMPVMNGLKAAAAIRALDRPDARTTPIIAMSADAYDEDIKKCLAAGMNSHTSKPISPDQLFAVLKNELPAGK